MPRDGEDVRVMVRLLKAARRDLDSIDNLRIRTADGREIPITQVAEFTYAPGINRSCDAIEPARFRYALRSKATGTRPDYGRYGRQFLAGI